MSGTNVQKDIDIADLLVIIWKERLRILSFTGTFVVLFAVVIFLKVKPVFVSSVLLVQTEASSTKELGAAAMLIGASKLGNNDADLYQSLLTSRTVTRKLLESNLEYFDSGCTRTRQNVFEILKIDTADPAAMEAGSGMIAKFIDVNIKENATSNIIKIDFKTWSPGFSQAIGNKAIKVGLDELDRVRSSRFDAIVTHLERAAQEAKLEWNISSELLTAYREKNRSIVLPEQHQALSRLEIEENAKEQKYLVALKELEMQRLDRVKLLPPYVVLDSANLPLHSNGSRRRAIFLLSVVASGFMGGGGRPWNQVREKWGINEKIH